MQMAPPLLLKVDSILRSRLECVSTQARDLQCTCNFLIFGRYRANMTVYIYYNPFTRPSGPSGQWPMNGQSSLIEGNVRTAYGKWWMIMIDIEWDGNMLWWTFNHVIIPYQYVSIQSKICQSYQLGFTRNQGTASSKACVRSVMIRGSGLNDFVCDFKIIRRYWSVWDGPFSQNTEPCGPWDG